jgi:hypothetical protein
MRFFKSLMPYMKEFSPLEKLQVRSKIQEVVLYYYSRKHEQPSCQQSMSRPQQQTFPVQQRLSPETIITPQEAQSNDFFALMCN